MHTSVPLACFLSVIRPFGVQFESALLQVAPVDKSKCPAVKNGGDIQFQLYTRYNPIVYQELVIGDDERLMASNLNFHDHTVIYFHAWMEMPDDGSGLMIREAYMQRGDANVIMVDASSLEAGPWYITAAENTWYIGRFAAMFVDYLVSRGLDLNKTHFVGHSLGAQAAGVAGGSLLSGRVSRITGLDPALPLFAKLPVEQRLDPTDAAFVDVIHTDSGIFGENGPTGHADFYPNGGISPQPGCELEVVIPKQMLLQKFFCSHWRSYMFYAESVLRPRGFVAAACGSWAEYMRGECVDAARARMGHGADPAHAQPQGYYTYYLQPIKSKSGKVLGKYRKRHQKTSHHLESKESIIRDIKTDSTLHDSSIPKLNGKIVADVKDKPSVSAKKDGLDTTHNIGNTDTDSIPDTPPRETYADTAFSDTEGKFASPIHQKPRKHDTASEFEANTKSMIDLYSTFADIKHDTSHVKKRQKRFLPFLKRSETTENDNFLFKLLEFVNKNRRNAIPIFTVMREINTLVKSANGELNHSTKERNNYIGHNPPVLPLATYNLELGSDSKVKTFVKKLLGLKVEGDRLTITGK